MFVTNAFSVNMLSESVAVSFCKLDTEQAKRMVRTYGAVSAIGHPDTAKVVSGLLGIELAASRINVSLKSGDMMLVAQYTGPRLPEGATELPEGAQIVFWSVVL